MNAQITGLMISLGAMQVARKIPFDDPDTLLKVRAAYITVQLIVLGIYYYLSYKIKQKNDMTVIKYVEPKSAFSQEDEKLVETTVKDYDLAETSKLVKSVFIGIAMMCFLHGYMKYTQPLFMQAIMGLKGLYDAKLVSIHLLGRPATGDLTRPFKAAPGMFGAAPPAPATDEASIKAAQKKIGGKKEE